MQLDTPAPSRVDTVEDLFNPDWLSRREKTRDLCQKVLFDELEKSGLVSRDRLWRSVFYDVICHAKRLRKGLSFTPVQQAYIRNLLLNGVGQLSLLMMKLREHPLYSHCTFRFDPNGVDNVVCTKLRGETRGHENEYESGKLGKHMLEVVYMCLVNIGDLYRYLADVYSKDNELHLEYFDQAQDYYTQAFLLNPASGLAHNQLGNLSLKLNDGLDSIYYLLYSMCSSFAYEGAYMNLKQLLDGQLVRLATMPAVAEVSQIDTFAHSFLAVIYHFVCTDGTHLKNFEKACQEALFEFHQLLNSEDAMENHLFIRIALTSIMTVWRLQSTNSIYVSGAVAFASGLFLNLINHLAAIMKSKCHLMPIIRKLAEVHTIGKPESRKEQEILEVELKFRSPEPEKTSEPEQLGMNGENGKMQNSKQRKKTKLGRRRRLRKRKVMTSGFCSDSDDDVDELSDDGSNATSSDSDVLSSDEDRESRDDENSDISDDYLSEGSEEDVKRNGLDNKLYAESVSSNDYYSDTSSVKTNGLVKTDEDAGKVEQLVLGWNELIESMDEVEPVIVAIVSFARWFHTSPAVISALASHCDNVFLQNLCDIMNVLRTVNWNRSEGFSSNLIDDWDELLYGKNGQNREELFSIELSEDRSTLGLPNFGNILGKLKHIASLHDYDPVIVRLARILSFGYWLSENDGFAMVYSKESNKFEVQSAKDEKFYRQARKLKELRDKLQNEDGNINGRREDSWRKHRVSSKGDWENGGRRRAPGRGKWNRGYDHPSDDTIYVFVDLPAVLNHFTIIRRLATYSKFLIIFPHSVHKTLDHLKETDEEGSREARIAVSWVERQKAVGAVKTLREHEKLPLKMDYPLKLDSDELEFLDVLESCHYFRLQENKNGRPATTFFNDIRDKYRILYLSGHLDPVGTSKESFDPVEAGQIARVYVDRVTNYNSRQGRKFRKKKFKG